MAPIRIVALEVTRPGRSCSNVGSPNRILREAVGEKVILRTGRRIPGVTPIGGVHDPIAVCRMAVEDAYGAKQWRGAADGDEVACRTETIRRSDCGAVAEYAFRAAKRFGGRV
jgi:isocitrate dehydrogenase (NAD+)